MHPSEPSSVLLSPYAEPVNHPSPPHPGCFSHHHEVHPSDTIFSLPWHPLPLVWSSTSHRCSTNIYLPVDGVFPQAGERMRSSHHGKVISNSFLITGAGGQVGFPRRGEAGAKRQAASFALWKQGPSWRCRGRVEGWKTACLLTSLGGSLFFRLQSLRPVIRCMRA